MAQEVDFRWIGGGYTTKAALLLALAGAGNAGKAGMAIEGGILTFAANVGGEVRSFSDVTATLQSLQDQINALQAAQVVPVASLFEQWQAGSPYPQGKIIAQTSGGYFTIYLCIEEDPGDPENPHPPESSPEYYTPIGSQDTALNEVLTWLSQHKANA